MMKWWRSMPGHEKAAAIALVIVFTSVWAAGKWEKPKSYVTYPLPPRPEMPSRSQEDQLDEARLYASCMEYGKAELPTALLD